MLRSILRASELCLASLPGLRFVRRWRARGSRCQAQAGRCRWRWGESSSWSSSRCFATCNLANFLRPLAPGRRTIRLLGCGSDSCQRGRSFWEPRSEGETCGKETGQRWVRYHSVREGIRSDFEKGPFSSSSVLSLHSQPQYTPQSKHFTHSHPLLPPPKSPLFPPPSRRISLPSVAQRLGTAQHRLGLRPLPPPFPSDPREAPKEVIWHSTVPYRPLGFGIISFVTQLIQLTSSIARESSQPGNGGRRGEQRE